MVVPLMSYLRSNVVAIDTIVLIPLYLTERSIQELFISLLIHIYFFYDIYDLTITENIYRRTVMHHWRKIIRSHVYDSSDVVGARFKTTVLCIFLVNSDIIVSIRSVVFMEETKCVPNLMQYNTKLKERKIPLLRSTDIVGRPSCCCNVFSFLLFIFLLSHHLRHPISLSFFIKSLSNLAGI